MQLQNHEIPFFRKLMDSSVSSH